MTDEIAVPPGEEDVETDETGENVAQADEPREEAIQGEESGSETAENADKEETTQRRRELRDSEITGTVTIEGEDFTLRDWSSSGFSVTDCKLEFETNARVDIDFSVTHSQGSLGFACKAIMVRRDEESCEAAGAFVEMAKEDRVAVAAYFDALEQD